jgi:hypothetical protein
VSATGFHADDVGWFVTGLDLGAQGVMVVASDQIFDAEFSVETETVRDFDAWWRPLGRRASGPSSYTASFRGREFHVVYAPTYREAMARLFTDWSPPEPKARALHTSVPEVLP